MLKQLLSLLVLSLSITFATEDMLGGIKAEDPQAMEYRHPADPVISQTRNDTRYEISGIELAMFVEGLLYGIIHEQYVDMDKCMKDISSMQNDLYLAFKDFESQTFEGMRQGLKDMANIIRSLATVNKDCGQIKSDLARLLQMAEILEHPLALMFRIGKNFLVNGVDIFKKFSLAMQARAAKNYFDCGRFMGEAFIEIVLKSPAVKKQRDEQAYDFLCGYMDGLLHQPLERVNIYNRMDQMGTIVMGPVIKTIQQYKMQEKGLVEKGMLGDGIWMGIMEFKHSFIDSGRSLVRKKALTKEQLDLIKQNMECLDKKRFFAIEDSKDRMEIVQLMGKAVQHYDVNMIEGVGEIFALITSKLCKGTPPSTPKQ